MRVCIHVCFNLSVYLSNFWSLSLHAPYRNNKHRQVLALLIYCLITCLFSIVGVFSDQYSTNVSSDVPASPSRATDLSLFSDTHLQPDISAPRSSAPKELQTHRLLPPSRVSALRSTMFPTPPQDKYVCIFKNIWHHSGATAESVPVHAVLLCTAHALTNVPLGLLPSCTGLTCLDRFQQGNGRGAASNSQCMVQRRR